MKAYVITHVSSFEPRAEAVGRWLQDRRAEVTWICSDFDHMQGRPVTRKNKDHVYLHLKPYKRHLSVKRLQSIRSFAGEVGRYLSGKKIDLLYILVPANSFVPMAEKLKAETGAVVVLDILDLWPESLPVEAVKKLPPLQAWKNLRDRHLSCADLIFTECGLYQRLIDLPQKKTHTLYWFGPEPAAAESAAKAEVTAASSGKRADRLEIAYMGAINYIIDRKAIRELLEVLQSRIPVTVHVIGEGETKDEFLKEIEKSGADYCYYGAVYDKQKKAEILSHCVCGLNMMVPQVRVGLTMKSLDYLAHGLPLLNNIPGDTWELVEAYDAGVNVEREDPSAVVEAILAMAKDTHAGEDAARLYAAHFTEECFRETLDDKLLPLLVEKGLLEAKEQKTPQPVKAGAKPVEHSKRTPVVSVALTVCNGEAYLAEQLDSILEQLGSEDEVIASVDPSVDASFTILCEYAARDSRIRITEGPGAGVAKNVEHALRQCRGEKIFLADQDDIWLPGKVEKVSRLLEQDTLVLHDAKIVDAQLQEQEPSFMQWRGSRKGRLANLWKNSYIGCCMAFRRELLEEILPFPDALPMHDQWIGLMAEKHGTVRLLRMPLLLYRRYEGTVTKDRHANMAQMLKWRAEITRELLRR